MSQMGRPKVENPKILEVKARIDNDLYRKLMDYCKYTGKKRADVVREGIIFILGQNNKTLPTDQS